MSYLGNSYLKEFIIGGGLQTKEHIASGGYRLDITHTTGLNRAWWDYEKIMEAPNGDGTNYAVFRLVGTDYYKFAVHIRNARSAKRGEVYCDLVSGKFLHVHIKIGGYASTNTKYLKYLEHLDPSIKISTNYGSNAYTGLNKGVHLPINNNSMFNYELYVKNNNLYMRVLSGSINANATVRNVTKGTSWQVFCNKSVGNDGGAINTGMEASLYEVNALGVVKQFDNRPAPVDPCAGVKGELANAQKTIGNKDTEISKLKTDLTGMTKDRDKYVKLVVERDQLIALKKTEMERLNKELVDTKQLLNDTTLELHKVENQLENVQPIIDGYEKTDREQKLKITTQQNELTRIGEALNKCREDKGLTFAELIQKIIDKISRK